MKKNIKAVIIRTGAAAVMIAAAMAMTGCSKPKNDETIAIETTEAPTEADSESEVIIEEIESDAADEDNYYSKDPAMTAGTINSVDKSGSIEIETIVKDEKGEVVADTTEPIIFHVKDGVPIIDAVTGEPVGLEELKEGSNVLAWMGDTMTMSLPAQTNLQALIVNIPADAAAPVYMVVKGAEWSKDDAVLSITGNDGSKWTAVNDKTQAVPYRTKQIVKLMDIKPGSRIMVWGSEDKNAEDGELGKVMLFDAE